MSTLIKRGVWISGREAARRLGISHGYAWAYARRYGIRQNVLEGVWTTYLEADVDRVAARRQVIGKGVA